MGLVDKPAAVPAEIEEEATLGIAETAVKTAERGKSGSESEIDSKFRLL